MRRSLKHFALALAGLGIFAGAAPAEDPARLHEQVRSRALATVGEGSRSLDEIRDALQIDPDFDRLLRYYWQASLDAVRSSAHSEDATQQTLLKTWKGRPDIFLRDHVEVVRYLRSSTKRNLLTELTRAARIARATGAGAPGPGLEETVDSACDSPTDEAEYRDLLATLTSRLDGDDRRVLAAQLEGAHSERQIARATGLTRHRAGRAKARIGEEIERILTGDGRVPQS